MIGQTLSFLRKHLNDHLKAEFGDESDGPSSDKVVFIDGDKMDPIAFNVGAVSALLIKVEEERVLRNPDLYASKNGDGRPQRVQPDLRLLLYVLFVARFKKYEVAWHHLSKIIEHLQSTRAFERATHPEMPKGVEKLIVELVTLGFAEQNEIWSALRTAHHPSILIRVNLVVLRDLKPRPLPRVEEEPVIQVGRIS